VSQELDFYTNNQKREGGRRPFCFIVVILFDFNEKIDFCISIVLFSFFLSDYHWIWAYSFWMRNALLVLSGLCFPH
jgi:hypothetical protein